MFKQAVFTTKTAEIKISLHHLVCACKAREMYDKKSREMEMEMEINFNVEIKIANCEKNCEFCDGKN